MEPEESTTGQMHFDTAGYLLRWSPDGLEVQAVDYHAGVLRLSWEMVERLRKRCDPAGVGSGG